MSKILLSHLTDKETAQKVVELDRSVVTTAVESANLASVPPFEPH